MQLGNGGAAGEWRVEFDHNMTTLTHLGQSPPAPPLSFSADTARLLPAQHVPGADHAVLDIHEGPTGSPAFGAFLVIPEHSEESWQKYGVNTLRKREMEHSGGLMAKGSTGTNCCTCWYVRPCIVTSMACLLTRRLGTCVCITCTTVAYVCSAAGSCFPCSASIATCAATCMADFTGMACLACIAKLGSCCCCLAYECDFYDQDYCEYYC